MKKIVISGTGAYVPPSIISNEELVATFNEYARHYNHTHQAEIAAGTLQPIKESSSEFIVKASGIKQRHVVERNGILDPQHMQPILRARDNNELCLQAEMGIAAIKQALTRANKDPRDVDLIVLSSAIIERFFPSIAIEMQNALGTSGYAFDMTAGCSSGTFGMHTVVGALKSGQATCAIYVDVNVGSCLTDFRDRDSHFIFGDAAVAVVVETTDTCQVKQPFEVVSSKLTTQFSNNIRSNFGLLNRLSTKPEPMCDLLFRQKGRQVFKEVIPFAVQFITAHLQECGLTPQQIKRFWLHQANININNLIVEKLLGRLPTPEEAPLILDRYANITSAGSFVTFDHYHDNLQTGDLGLICSFGAGYSLGSILLKKL